MAISKQQVLKSLNRDQLSELNDYERKIDGALRERYDGTPLWIGMSLPTHKRVRDELQKRYRAAGWTLRYEYDQRDGSSIVVS